MLRSISIRNFRGIESLDADLARVSAMLGPNSSGKTSVLHAVRLACELLRRAVESETPARIEASASGRIGVTTDTLLSDAASLLSLADWEALFVNQQVGERVSLRVVLTFEDSDPVREVWVEVACARNDQLKYSASVVAPEAVALVAHLPKKSSQINRSLTEFLRERVPRAVLIPPFYGTVPAEELRSRAVIDRLLGSGDQSHAVRNLVAGLSSAQLEGLNRFLEATLGARIVDRTSGDDLQTRETLRVRFADSNGPLELSAAGAGLVNLVSLYAALARWSSESQRRRVLFLLDEPEAHLSPRVQAQTVSELGRLVTQEFGAQLLLATHSVDILNRLCHEGARLLRCDRTRAPSVTVLDSDASLFGDLARWADLTPYTAINFLAARRILFVEGRDELALLPRLMEVRFRNDPGALQRARRWALVELRGARNEGVGRLLAALVQSEAVRAEAQRGSFEVLVVLDRDYERTPGWSEAQQSGPVRHRTLVWSQHSLESLLASEEVLPRWLRAFLGEDAPPELEALVRAALQAADLDPDLQQDAIARYSASLVVAAARDGASPLAGEGREVRAASLRAQQELSREPRAWQHGKERARFLLRRVREGLPPRAQGQLPTDLVALVERTDLRRFPLSVDAIPAELGRLLEELARL